MNKILLMITLFSCLVEAAQKDTAQVIIDRISVYDQNGATMIHTEPKHIIEGTTCTTDFWIQLNRDDPNFQTMLSVILSAQATRTPADITVTDEFGTPNCYLSRITLRYDY